MRRLRRDGLLQVKVFPLFGYYPWQCGNCRAKMLLRNRGKHAEKREPGS